MSQCNHGAQELDLTIGIIYASIQIAIALFVSIIGAKHVRRCKNEEKKAIQKAEMMALKTIMLNTGNFIISSLNLIFVMTNTFQIIQ